AAFHSVFLSLVSLGHSFDCRAGVDTGAATGAHHAHTIRAHPGRDRRKAHAWAWRRRSRAAAGRADLGGARLRASARAGSGLGAGKWRPVPVAPSAFSLLAQ